MSISRNRLTVDRRFYLLKANRSNDPLTLILKLDLENLATCIKSERENSGVPGVFPVHFEILRPPGT